MKHRSPLAAALAIATLALAFCLQASSQQPAPAAATAGAAAQTPSPIYNIEVIVFRATSTLGAPEGWSSEGATNLDANSPEEQDAGAASSAPSMGRFVGALTAAQFQLTDIEAKLKSSGGYVPVAHAAWSQTASPWGSHAGFPVQRLGLEAAGLTGTIFLERGQYLHLGMALNYSIPTTPAGLGATPGTSFVLSSNRRIRFYERNYYDHPAFGVIALVTPAQGRPAGR